MIKCEVVFDGDYIHCYGFKMYESYRTENWHILNADGIEVEQEMELEQAIKYCMEH